MKNRNVLNMLFGGMALLPVMAFAQAGHVGGGNGVVCFDQEQFATSLTDPNKPVSKTIPDSYLSHIVSIEALDLFEAKRPTGLEQSQPDLVETSLSETADQFANRLLSKLDVFKYYANKTNYAVSSNWHSSVSSNLSLFEMYTMGKNLFSNKIYVSNDQGLFPSNDIDPMSKASKKCIYTTIAKQRELNDNSRELSIDGRLFNHKKHSELSKKVFIIHEYLLATADLFKNDVSLSMSDPVRNLVGAVLVRNTTAFDIMNLVNQGDLYKSLRIVHESFDGDQFSYPKKYDSFNRIEQFGHWSEMEAYISKLNSDYEKAWLLACGGKYPYVNITPVDPKKLQEILDTAKSGRIKEFEEVVSQMKQLNTVDSKYIDGIALSLKNIVETGVPISMNDSNENTSVWISFGTVIGNFEVRTKIGFNSKLIVLRN